jgi:hypothetical protein
MARPADTPRCLPMADVTTTISLAAADLPAFRTAVVECIVPAEHERCERLLGQLASLEARATNAMLRFVPAPGTHSLAFPALARLQQA